MTPIFIPLGSPKKGEINFQIENVIESVRKIGGDHKKIIFQNEKRKQMFVALEENEISFFEKVFNPVSHFKTLS